MKSIQRKFTVDVPIEKAFSIFTDKLEYWWPSEYTWSGNILESIGIEPKEGGVCFELGPNNFECDWGQVLKWNPPHQFVILWQISPSRVPEPNPKKASKVEVQFEEQGTEKTIVTFEHSNFENHGEGATEYREAMDSPKGWDYILDKYKKTINNYSMGVRHSSLWNIC